MRHGLASLAGLLFGLLGTVGGAAHASGVDALRGLDEIEIAVVGLSPQLESAGFDRERIYDAFERKLQRTRLLVRPFAGGSIGVDRPVLQVVPECAPLSSEGYLCRLRLELLEAVSPNRDMTLQLVAPTWSWSWVGEVDRLDELRVFIDSATGQFADDHFAVN